ncbi:hypothetical protein [Lujinxingia litoralis]|nr:hypothetical protein [Lujinxingia litoralis]
MRTYLFCLSLMLAACNPKPDSPTSVVSPEANPPTHLSPPSERNETMKENAAPIPKTPVEPSHFVFVASPQNAQMLDCPNWESPEAPHRRRSLPMNDTTDSPTRHEVSFTDVIAIQNPSGIEATPHHTHPIEEVTATAARVAFALSPLTFTNQPSLTHDAFGTDLCKQLNELFSAPYVVLHAYPVHVDRGNSAEDPWRDSWESLGTDPSCQSRAFSDQEAALAYARSLISATE